MIIYKNEIKEAYTGLPDLGLMDLNFGDIINTTPGDCHWWPPGDAIHRVAVTEIIKYQDRMYPDRIYDYIYSVHSIVHTFQGRYFETTSPVGRFGRLTPRNIDHKKRYIVCRYKDWTIRTAEEREIFYKVFNELKGKRYDYGQLVAILINELMDWSPADYLSIFDLSRKRKVCSVMAMICWLRWWKLYAKPNNLEVRRPGGFLHAEKAPPAHFELHRTFGIAGLLKI